MSGKSTEIFLIPLAYDHIQGKTGRGSKARCQALADRVKRVPGYLDSNCVVVVSAGYTKESPATPTPEQSRSLAYQQVVFMRTLLPQADYIVKPPVWGTENEIRAASEYINQYCLYKNIDPKLCEVLISSNPIHLFRVKIWCRHVMSDMNIQFIEADHRFSIKETVRELLKLARDHYTTKYFDVWPY